MAGDGYSRSLEQTPTWAVAVVCFVLIAISIILEYIIHYVGKWLKKKNKLALHEALEKIKAELMLLGFISLLLTVGEGPISDMCIPESVADTWHPCKKKKKEEVKANGARRLLYNQDSDWSPRRILAGKEYDKCTRQGKVSFVSTYGIHQLHIFIFVLAIVHVLYCILTISLARAKMRSWKTWEKETRTVEYEYSHDPERFRFARNTTFGRRHLSFWSNSPVLLWTVCFFRQFFKSVLKTDYMTLRHGFITAHLAPENVNKFDFQKYINRSLEDDLKVIVGISPLYWFIAILFIMSNTHGWLTYLWLPFIPLIIILLVGTKLQVNITTMGLRIQEKGDVVRGVPTVKPTDELFWFNRPRFIFSLIHFVLFQNAFQIAFFAWTTYEFGLHSCYHERDEDIAIRISVGILIQFLCSYVTLPLYALVTHMGTTMNPVIFDERVTKALKEWHHTAKRHIKQNWHSPTVTPTSSMPSSPAHLLRNHPDSANYDQWGSQGSLPPSSSPNHKSEQVGFTDMGGASIGKPQISIGSSTKDFSFDKQPSSK